MALSESGPSLIRRAHAVHPVTCVEQEWSLWSRDIEESIVPVCKELGIGILAYSPLGRGFLTGMVKRPEELPEGDYRKNGQPRLQVWQHDDGRVSVHVSDTGCQQLICGISKRLSDTPRQLHHVRLVRQHA